MPDALRTHKPRRALPQATRTLKERAQDTGRTLALNGATWRRLRACVLSRWPLCPRCQEQGYIERAIEVDHIDGDPKNNLMDNLEGLCKMHHGQKTRHAQVQKSPATEELRTALSDSRTPPHLLQP